MSKAKANEELRTASGTFTSDDPLVGFLYDLMRDNVTPGQVQSLITRIKGQPTKNAVFSNGWLAQYAEYLAEQLRPPT